MIVLNWLHAFAFFLAKVLLFALVSALFAALACWQWFEWSLASYATTLMWAGIIVMGVGVLTGVGSTSMQGGADDPAIYLARSVTPLTGIDWARQEMLDSVGSLRFTLLMSMVGILLLAGSYLVMVLPALI